MRPPTLIAIAIPFLLYSEYLGAAVLASSLMTPRDLVYSKWFVGEFEEDDPAKLGYIALLPETVGKWIDDVHLATKVSDHLQNAMPLGNQPGSRLARIVKECSDLIGVSPPPEIWVTSNPNVDIYTDQVGMNTSITVTSGLLDLFEKDFDGLRFMIGREIGHVKMRHIIGRRHGRAFAAGLATIGMSAVKPEFQQVVLPLASSRLLSWYREMELSADRAGLICVKDIDIAERAIISMLTGLKKDAEFLKDLDVDQYLRDFKEYESLPFVEALKSLREWGAECPFPADRIVMLRRWVSSSAYESLIEGIDRKPSMGIVFVVSALSIQGLAKQTDPIDAFVVLASSDKAIQMKSIEDSISPTWTDLDISFEIKDGEVLVVHVKEEGGFFSKDRDIGSATFLFNVSDCNKGEFVLSSSLDVNWLNRGKPLNSSRTVQVQIKGVAKHVEGD